MPAGLKQVLCPDEVSSLTIKVPLKLFASDPGFQWRSISHPYPTFSNGDSLMKLLIACDMEGISGVINWDGSIEQSRAQRFCKIMTAERERGYSRRSLGQVDEFLVADGHWNSTTSSSKSSIHAPA
jgi:hypothetical protein